MNFLYFDGILTIANGKISQFGMDDADRFINNLRTSNSTKFEVTLDVLKVYQQAIQLNILSIMHFICLGLQAGLSKLYKQYICYLANLAFQRTYI